MAQRDKIKRALSRKAEMNAREIAKVLRCSRRSVSEILESMTDEGIITVAHRNNPKGGLQYIYSLAPTRVPLLQEVWRGTLDRVSHPSTGGHIL